MRRALFTTALTTLIILTSAYTPAHASPAVLKPAVIAAPNSLNSAEHITISSSSLQRAAPIQTIALNASTNTNPATNPATMKADQPDSGWQYPATLLTTLVLIGIIAVRRHTAGRH